MPIPEDAPILRHREWRYLLRALAEQVDRSLARIEPKDLMARLVAPVTLARSIAWSGLSPKDPEVLRIAVIGAEQLDAFDDGKWYGLVPWLLGASAGIKVHLVGPRLGAHGGRFPTLGPPTLGRVSVHPYPASLAAAWGALPVAALDLAILFQPGFENNQGWFGGADLRLLVESGVPVAVTSYGYDEHLIDRCVLEAYGFGAEDGTAENPFYMEMGHPNIRWGHTLWRMAARRPPLYWVPDQARIDGVHRLSVLLARLFAAGYVSDASRFGQVHLSDSPQERPLIYLAADVYVDPQDGRVLRRRASGWADTGRMVSRERLAARPEPPAPTLAAAVWAADLVGDLL